MLSTMPKNTGIVILALEPPNGGSKDYDKIEDGLLGLDGVLNTDVNYLTHMIKIEFNSEKLTIDEIQDKLERLEEKAKAPVNRENK